MAHTTDAKPVVCISPSDRGLRHCIKFHTFPTEWDSALFDHAGCVRDRITYRSSVAANKGPRFRGRINTHEPGEFSAR